jgi:hypothetical protein
MYSYVCLSVRPSVRPSIRIKQSRPYWTDFQEILYLSIFFFSKFLYKIQVSLKPVKNKEYFTSRRIKIYDNIYMLETEIV